MNAAWFGLAVLILVCRCDSSCSQTSYYNDCWIRRFPGLFVDLERSERRGAHVLLRYQAESALRCSRTCCHARNLSCNVALFHYESSEDRVNCFHLHCPDLQSCVLTPRRPSVLFNITNGVDPDLLVFEKYFTSNVRLMSHHYSRTNVSDLLSSDKRHFFLPPPPAAPSTVTPSTTTARRPPTPQTTSATLPVSPSVEARTTITTFSLHAADTPSPSTAQPSPSAAPNSSSPTPTKLQENLESSKQSGNHSTGEEDTLGGSDARWTVNVYVFVTVLGSCFCCCCCCFALLQLRWRARKRRKGNYQTSRRVEKSSMRLGRYVLVREHPWKEETGK